MAVGPRPEASATSRPRVKSDKEGYPGFKVKHQSGRSVSETSRTNWITVVCLAVLPGNGWSQTSRVLLCDFMTESC